MPEPTQITFTHKEVVEALVRKQDIHNGIWGLYVRFGINAANIGQEPASELLPAAIIPVLEIGIQRFDKVNNLSVDASVVNPKPDSSRKKKKHDRNPEGN